VELWLGHILAKCESQSGKGHMNTRDSVCSLGLWLKRRIHDQDVVRGFTPQRCSSWCDSPQIETDTLEDRTNLVPAIEQM